MQVKYNALNHRYIESSQKNPIRWMLLKHEGNSVFTNITNVFKCKDYFNDFVVFGKLGEKFSVHGMPSSAACFEPDGSLYVLVYGLFDQFEQNVKNVIDPTFGKEWGCSFQITRLAASEIVGASMQNAAIIKFSPKCFMSTFRISCLSLFLRNCNVPYVVPDYDARLDGHFVTEACWTRATYEFFKDRCWVFPLQEQFVWYVRDKYNNTTHEASENLYTVHDNGVNSWLYELQNQFMPGGIYDFWKSLPVFGEPLPESNDRASWDTDEEVEDEYDEEYEES